MADETKTTDKAEKKKRTRKVGGLMAFSQIKGMRDGVEGGTGLEQVANWPDGIKTKEAAKKAYVELKLTGKVILMRYAGSLEAKSETVTKFL